MAAFRVVLVVAFVACISALPTQIGRADDVSLTIRTILSYGYPAEAHRVTTSDGYILEMHRIPHGKGQQPSSNRPVIFLMHGLTGSSDNYIYLGPESALAFNLADAGYDVWMGNARGNKDSRRHVSLNPDDSKEKLEFFDFTWEEIALIDLPAMFNHALATSGQDKFHYIGHSQGGTVFFVLMSTIPEWNDKLISVHLMAGVGYMRHFPSKPLVAAAMMSDVIYNTARSIGFVEVPAIDIDTKSANDCFGTEELVPVCTINREIGYGTENVGLTGAGASLKQIAHYGQNIRDKEFRRWSYGVFQNLKQYGTTSPPKYDLSKITAEVTMHYTVADNLLDEADVLAMAADMPNATPRKVARETFSHVDFVTADDAKALVTDYIIRSVKVADENLN